MHPAPPFTVRDEARLLAHLAAYPFVTLVAAPESRMLVAQAPVTVRRLASGLAVDFHLSRNNALAPHLKVGFPAVMVSLGPNAYISPDWYGNADQVPTWNYVSVEVEGPITPLDDAGLVALLDDLSGHEEERLAPKPIWTRGKMSAGVFERMTRAIIGGRLMVQRLEGTFKLGQNKSEADRAGAVAGLGGHPIAGLMRDVG